MATLPITDVDGQRFGIDIDRILAIVSLDIERTAITTEARVFYVKETTREVTSRINAARMLDWPKYSPAAALRGNLA